MALGENWLGAGKDLRTFVCVALGTGVGGGIVIDNKLYHGSHYCAAEIGFLRATPRLADFLEKNASTAALVKKFQPKEGMPALDGEYIFEKIRVNDKYFLKLFNEWIFSIASGLSDIVYLLDPQAIVIGGGVSGSPDILLPAIKEALGVFMREGFGCEIRVTKLGNNAGMLGAVYPLTAL